MGRWELSVALAQWLAFQLSLWHETVTWYGWSAVGLFPEKASAFSPEDIYSNLLGTRLAGFALLRGDGEREDSFNDAMDGSITELLANAIILPREVTENAARSIDGVWWDSNARLPQKDLVLRRNLDLGPEIAPWVVPPERYTEALGRDLATHCAGHEARPIPLRLTTGVGISEFTELARFDVFADEAVAAQFPGSSGGSRWVGQDDFPVLVDAIRQEVREERGPEGDRP